MFVVHYFLSGHNLKRKHGDAKAQQQIEHRNADGNAKGLLARRFIAAARGRTQTGGEHLRVQFRQQKNEGNKNYLCQSSATKAARQLIEKRREQ
jgi:hypothetical protein